MWDIQDKGFADSYCAKAGSETCTVCVQSYDAKGNPIVWEDVLGDCPCPPTADAGTTPVSPTKDGGPASCIGEWDIPSESLAQNVCDHESDGSTCSVCVQSYDDAGAPSVWVAMFNCPCPGVDAGKN